MKKILVSCLIIVLALSFCVASVGSVARVSLAENKDAYTARALYLIDTASNTTLYEKSAEEKMPVASIVKLMTIEITLEELEAGRLSLDEVVVASEYASSMGGSQVFIEAGGEYTVGDLLKSAIVASANDASVALAERIAGSETEFVRLMNKRAQEFDMQNTNYMNSTGLPAPNQFSCAKDTATLLKKVTSFDTYHNYSTIWMDTLKHPKGRESELVNTNKLIRYYEGCDGGKTGSTSEAGYCLAASAKRGDMRLIGVVLGAKDGKSRFGETSTLLNYGFSNFESKTFVRAGEILNDRITVKSGKVKTVPICAKENLSVVCKKRDDNANYEVKTVVNDVALAPINAGDKVGEIMVIKDGVVLCQSDLVANQTVSKATLFDNLKDIASSWSF